jgi:hypothetical protein
MVDWYGRWTWDPTLPKKKWCVFDYLADRVTATGYQVQTSLEHLLVMICTFYDSDAEETDAKEYETLTDIPFEKYANRVMDFVNLSGGLQEFDYEC